METTIEVLDNLKLIALEAANEAFKDEGADGFWDWFLATWDMCSDAQVFRYEIAAHSPKTGGEGYWHAYCFVPLEDVYRQPAEVITELLSSKAVNLTHTIHTYRTSSWEDDQTRQRHDAAIADLAEAELKDLKNILGKE